MPKLASTSEPRSAKILSMTNADLEEVAGHLPDFIKRVKAGDHILLFEGNQPVARLIPVAASMCRSSQPLNIRPFQGHAVLTPNITHSEIAEEMFGQ